MAPLVAKVVVVQLLVMLCMARLSAGVGVNWGTQLSHPLPASTGVQLLKDNGFDKVKLFEAEDGILGALKGSGIQVMVGIPNDMLADLAGSDKAAENWVAANVSKHVSDGVDIRSSSWRAIKPFSGVVLERGHQAYHAQRDREGGDGRQGDRNEVGLEWESKEDEAQP